MKKLALFLMLTLFGASMVVAAPPRQSFIKVTVTPDHADWCYTCGEKPQFAVTVTDCSNAPIKNAQIYYEQLLNRVRLCDPMDCHPRGSSVRRVFQTRILEWLPLPTPRESF